MQLKTVIVLPPAVTDAVDAALRAARISLDPGAAESDRPRRRLFGSKRGSGSGKGSTAEVTALAALDLVAPEQMSLPLAAFGNVTRGDGLRLAEALRTAAAGSPRATIRLAGGTALEFPSDLCVWAKLDGDIEALNAIAREVTQAVERLGFFVDRRKYRPLLAVATVNDQTTAADLQSAVDALEAFRGEPWTVDYVSLVTTSFEDGASSTQEIERLPLMRN